MIFEINKTYTFSTLAPTILGGLHTALKVTSVMSATEAASNGYDIYTRHNSLRSVITDLTVTPNDLTFIKFESTLLNETATLVLALEYIDLPTAVEVSSLNVRVNVFSTDSGTISRIRVALKEIGLANFNIETF